MTSETRTYIDLTDITEIEFTCPHCKGKFLCPIGSHDRLSDKCPNCFTEWFITNPQPANSPTSVDGVKKVIDGLRSLTQSPFIRARVRLSVAGVPKPEGAN